MGFVAFIVALATLSAFFENLENIGGRGRLVIGMFLAVMGGYRFVKKLFAQRKAQRERNDREELKEELRQEIRKEMSREAGRPKQLEIMEAQATTEEEPYYPEVKYYQK